MIFSMCQTDIKPNRLEQPSRLPWILSITRSSTQIGIVAFAGFAELVQNQPTTGCAPCCPAWFERACRTAIGSAILKALDTIAEQYEDVAPVDEEPQLVPGLENQVAGNFAPT
jgi:hypothetical protein